MKENPVKKTTIVVSLIFAIAFAACIGLILCKSAKEWQESNNPAKYHFESVVNAPVAQATVVADAFPSDTVITAANDTVVVRDGMKVIDVVRYYDLSGSKKEFFKIIIVKFSRELLTDSVRRMLEVRGLKMVGKKELEGWLEFTDTTSSASKEERPMVYKLVALGDSINSSRSVHPFFPSIFLPFVTSVREMRWENGELKNGGQIWPVNTAFAVRVPNRKSKQPMK